MSGRAGAYNNIEAIREWFFRHDKPYWVLYNSIAPVAALKIRNRTDFNDKIETVDESWIILEQELRHRSRDGGNFTILIDQHSKMNNAIHATLSIGYNPNQIAGINGVSGTPSAGFMTVDQFDSKIREFKNEQKIEALEDQIEELKHGTDGIGRLMRFTENNPEVAINLISNIDKIAPGAMNFISGIFSKRNPAINGHDNADSIEAPTVDENSEEYKKEFEVQKNKVEGSLEKISQHFEDVPEFLEKVSNFIEKNPDQAKMFFDAQK